MTPQTPQQTLAVGYQAQREFRKATDEVREASNLIAAAQQRIGALISFGNPIRRERTLNMSIEQAERTLKILAQHVHYQAEVISVTGRMMADYGEEIAADAGVEGAEMTTILKQVTA